MRRILCNGLALAVLGLSADAYCQIVRGSVIWNPPIPLPQLWVGKEIDLPICVWQKRPPGSICTDGRGFPLSFGKDCQYDQVSGRPMSSAYLLQPDPSSKAFDWGKGNAIRGVSYALCQNTGLSYTGPDDFVEVFSPAGEGETTLAEVTGAVEHVENAYVRGYFRFERSSFGTWAGLTVADLPVSAAIQVLDETGWREVLKRTTQDESGLLELSMNVAPQASVRLVVKMLRRPTAQRSIRVNAVRLFGAQCFINGDLVCAE